MNNMINSQFSRLAGIALISGSVLLAGCDVDDLLEVNDIDTVNPTTLEDESALSIVVNGAISEFVNAYSSGESYSSVTALFSDEYRSAGTFSTRNASDRRDQQPIQQGNTSDGTYINLHQARYALQDAAGRVEQFQGTSDPRYSEMKALEALTLVMLGEAYCSSAPVSQVDGAEFIFGAPQTSAQTLQDAISTASSATGDLAAIVTARAYLSLGEYSQAAAAVSNVPDDFVYYANHSIAGDQNGLWTLGDQRRYSIPNGEGGNGIRYRDIGTLYNQAGTTILEPGDPRIPYYLDSRLGFDDNYDAAKEHRYFDREAELPVASGVEARLIEAEAALQSNPGQMIAILNDLRANVATNMALLAPDWTPAETPTLDPLTDPGTPDARRDLLFQERALWLFLTGHRMADLRRLVANYGLDAEDVYPTGVYYKDDGSLTDVYDTDVVFPVDFDEANNPEYSLDLCNVSSASYN